MANQQPEPSTTIKRVSKPIPPHFPTLPEVFHSSSICTGCGERLEVGHQQTGLDGWLYCCHCIDIEFSRCDTCKTSNKTDDLILYGGHNLCWDCLLDDDEPSDKTSTGDNDDRYGPPFRGDGTDTDFPF